MKPIIEFKDVCISFDKKPLLSNVSFNIYPGEKIGIVGPSGSGKSSILMVLAGAVRPVSGEVTFNDLPLTNQTIHQIRSKIGFIGQEPFLAAETIRDALLLPFTFRANHEKKPPESKILEILNLLYLDQDILSRSSSVVSGGEKQRIAIARALLLGKSVFLADEITSALDNTSKNAVITLFSRNKYTIISASHDQSWLSKCTRRFSIIDGYLAEEATT